ncbi:cytochrome P450 6A1-like [Colletes gigas]|uniref:cytochrome P450 6A1-like n=1 Tax=Colletes gigas TaxID=935657 RepID=UPI001C9B0FD8|nr:cytochrome P450 6A1-like [Colletes gigas]
MEDYFVILSLIVITLLTLYYYFTLNFDFWKIRGVPGPKPVIFFGNVKDWATRKLSISQFVAKIYNEYKHEPVFGIFQRYTPVLIVNDLNLIKDVLIRDFSVFAGRGLYIFKKAEPLSEHLFQLEPERWRPIRSKLSPVFTSGRLKEMFPLIIECAEHLEEYLDKTVKNGEPIECREVAARFTTDVIGSCAFGMNMNSFKDENNIFRLMGRKVFHTCAQQEVRDVCREFMPYLYDTVGHTLQPTGVYKFFTDTIVDAINYRIENNVFRPDFVHMLKHLKQHPDELENIELTDSLLTSQAYIFFLAGFETSSSTMGFALYELAQNHHIQEKLRAEIREHSPENSQLTYKQVKGMKYLEMVFRETLRKYSILPVLIRQAAEDYTFRGTKITIPKNTSVWIPIYPLQNDPDIYPDPDKFDPERFTDEAIAKRHPMSFLSFGDGPRNCIGARFAHYQSKIGLITFLRNHKVDICEKTTIPFETVKQLFLLTIKEGVHLSVTKAP